MTFAMGYIGHHHLSHPLESISETKDTGLVHLQYFISAERNRGLGKGMLRQTSSLQQGISRAEEECEKNFGEHNLWIVFG